eukprot:RCo025225
MVVVVPYLRKGLPAVATTIALSLYQLQPGAWPVQALQDASVQGERHIAEVVPLPYVTPVVLGLQVFLRPPADKAALGHVVYQLSSFGVTFSDPDATMMDRGVSYRGSFLVPMIFLVKFMEEFCPYSAFQSGSPRLYNFPRDLVMMAPLDVVKAWQPFVDARAMELGQGSPERRRNLTPPKLSGKFGPGDVLGYGAKVASPDGPRPASS